MTSTAWLAFVVVFLGNTVFRCTGFAHEEKDFSCPHTDDERAISPTSVCDGTVDCVVPITDDGDWGVLDESHDICAPRPYLERPVVLKSRNVTSTSAQVSWSTVIRHDPDHPLKLAGYFLSGKSVPHSFQNSISARLNSYQLQWLKPWTEYTLVLRPFYTMSGKHESAYKLGRAASFIFRTLASEPEMPGLVSVLSPKQRNVLLNIIGPSAWNSLPGGFHVRWEATSELHGPRGEMDFALPTEWSPEENVLNVTLPLQGGMDYCVSVSAVGTGDTETTLRGPEADVNVSIPLDSYEVSANAIGSSKSVISWRASEQVDYFKVTVFIDKGFEDWRAYTVRELKGTGKVSSRYRVIIANLLAWRFYMVRLEGCTEDICNHAVNTTFGTLPDDALAPSVTRVEATGKSGFQIEWVFSQPDRRLHDGFRVRYCQKDALYCVLVHTQENNLTVHGLKPETAFDIEVRAQFRSTNNRPLLGPAGTADVTTWSNVPVAQVKYEANLQDAIDLYWLSWKCINSSFEYLQYKITDRGQWITCQDAAECECTVNYGRTQTSASGDLILTHQSLNEDIWVRCCNIHGCGTEALVNSRILGYPFGRHRLSGHPSVSAVTVFRREKSAILKFDPPDQSSYSGFETTWSCKGENEIHQSEISIPKRIYYKFEPPYNQFHKYEQLRQTDISGLTANAEECEFFFSLYKDNIEGRYYSSPVRATQL